MIKLTFQGDKTVLIFRLVPLQMDAILLDDWIFKI